jgi:hypothetical protein
MGVRCLFIWGFMLVSKDPCLRNPVGGGWEVEGADGWRVHEWGGGGLMGGGWAGGGPDLQVISTHGNQIHEESDVQVKN